MKEHWMDLAGRAAYAAVVMAPWNGPNFELCFLDAEPEKEHLRAMSLRGLSPVALIALTRESKLEIVMEPVLWRGWECGAANRLLGAARSEFLQGLAAMSAKAN